ncbi:MAG TPA: serine hydrolase [Vitreimonas sp.]|uniref:serine hydrolase domain-containing protein n=1 Tax=Vitreimonas sp. TaxID=3069702 RepID=UPI002D5B3517|nr:serine hydrolase [Vitreimonas sp.]HYD87631.1 serine hydrolase [Vitreimonas sp.]
MLRRVLVAASLMFAATAQAQELHPLPPQPAGVAWPTQEWEEAPLPADVDRAAFDLAVTEAFGGVHERLGETRAVIVVQSGRIVFERYAAGYGRDTRLNSWSMAKSVTHALVGAAVLQGRVAVDTPMGNPHWPASDRRASITWREWLQMVDGLEYDENAEDVQNAGNARMLFGDGRRDVARWAAARPLIRDPGTHWNYSSAATILISDALTGAIVPDPRDTIDRRNRMRAWMGASLFDRIGMRPVVEFDPQGTFYGSSLVWASARDFARFGYLYLRGGVWDGQRVLPAGWVDFARTPGSDADTDVYGAQWWLTPRSGPGRPDRSLITDNAMADAFSAQGHEGQIIVVVPSKDLVMVRLGLFHGGLESWNALGAWSTRLIGAFGRRDAGRGTRAASMR